MPPPRGLIQTIDQELHRTHLLPRGARLLVAVSGGADSVALLRLLMDINKSNHWGWVLVVGHVDHGIRGDASAQDAEFVKDVAVRFELECDERKLKLPADASEELARSKRYRALSDMASFHHCAGVVFGHHADDQAETVLMHMFRGCGIAGIRAMVEETKSPFDEGMTVWRPLLQVRAAELREYLRDISQVWREDASNESMDYLRNRVRTEVLPVIEKVWPQGIEALSRLSRIAREAQEVLAGEAKRLWDQRRDGDSGIEFPRDALREAFPALTAEVLRWSAFAIWGDSETVSYERISEAVRLIRGREGGRKIQLGRGVNVELDGDTVRVLCTKDTPEVMKEKVWYQ